jgi:hypothetical protein
MQLRGYSILGTLLLALSVASPALAAGKGKKKSSDSTDAASSSAAKEGDDKADSASEDKAETKAEARKAKRDKKKKGKKGKADEEKATEEAKADEKAGTEGGSDALGTSAASSEQAEMPDPNVWEKPPEEKEKPKPVDTPAPVVEMGDNRPWSAGLAAGWGVKTDRATGGFGADPYAFAAGVRGGYAFDFDLYIGIWFNWYLGTSSTGSQARSILGEKTTRANYWQFGVDVGYDWWIADIIIRPSMQLGEAIAVTDATGETRAIGDFMLAPGMTVIYPWDNLFLGGELRGNIVTGDGVSALLIAAQFGMRFEG